MQGKKAFCSILLCANALVCALLCAIKGFGAPLFASFEFAFFATLFIIVLSFLSYKKSIFQKVGAERAGKNFTQQSGANSHTGQKFTQSTNAEKNFAQQNGTNPQNAEFYAQPQPLIFYQKKPLQPLPKNLKFKAINEDFKPSFKVALKNFGAFFSLVKLCAYAFLALGFLVLQRQNLLDIVAFLSGISSVLLSVLIFAGLCVYKQPPKIKKTTKKVK